ncbi:MAG: hypothetical protein H6Q13_2010, partial [Bacteroidetes bacterium]|nr:hypothetical protein [Bacteroidota bacterium]
YQPDINTKANSDTIFNFKGPE